MTLTIIKKILLHTTDWNFVTSADTGLGGEDLGLDPPYLEPAYYKWWIFMRLLVLFLFWVGWVL